MSAAKFTAIALVYGRPHAPARQQYIGMAGAVPYEFVQVLRSFFNVEEIRRTGMKRLAYDYAEWYEYEDHKRQSACDDGLLSQAQDQIRGPRRVSQHGEGSAAIGHDGTERSTHSLPA